MTTEDDFQKHLDADPTDWQTRLVFADWLEERGDGRAAGYRALGMLRLVPYPERVHDPGPDRWGYHDGEGRVLWVADRAIRLEDPVPAPDSAALHPLWLKALQQLQRDRKAEAGNQWWSGQTRSRRDIEDAAALAFATLPPELRAALLGGRPPAEERKPPRRKRKAK